MKFNKQTIRILIPLMILIIVAAAVLSLFKIEADTRRDLAQNLKSSLETSRASVLAWTVDQKTTIRLWAVNGELRRLVNGLLEIPDTPEALKASPVQNKLRDLMTPVFKSRGLKGYFIIGPDNVNLGSSRDHNLGSTNPMDIHEGFLDRVWAGETLISPPQRSWIELRDVFGELEYALATMFSVTPVWGENGNVVALLAFRLEPDEGISQRLEWARVGGSGETYAINKDGMMISESRFNKQLFELGLIKDARHSDLNLRVADPGVDLTQGLKAAGAPREWPLTRMAAAATAGKDGIDLDGYRDYRGVEVVGAWVWDHQLGFAIASEIDITEAYGLLRETRAVVILFAGFGTILLLALVVMFERGQARLAKNIRELDFQKFAADEHAIISASDADGNITEVNDKFIAISGYQPEELIGKNHRILKSGEHPPEFYEHMWETLVAGKVWHGDVKNKRKDGSYYWVKATIVPFVDDNGKPFRYLSIRTDITERVEAAENLRQSKELLNLAIEGISDGFALFDADDRLVLCNKKYRNMNPTAHDVIQTGASFEEIIRAGAERGGHPDAEGREEEWVAERLASRKKPVELFEYENNTGKWIRVSEQALSNGGRVGLRTDVTELKEATAMADEANRAKSEFLSSMSHELRTPLNAILGFGQMLEFNPKEPLSEGQKSCVDQILRGGRHLLELINEVLDLAKIEAGHMNISIDDIRVRDVIEECLSLIVTMADARGITVNIESGADDWPSVRADYTRLRQILLNLLSNAVKYNNDGGAINISSHKTEADMLRISVADTGPGIPEKKQPELFQPFSRLGAETTETEGTGIGLTITRKMVEMMDGNIGLDSVEGEGSTFWVELPLSDEQHAEDAVGQADRQDVTPVELPETAGTVLYVEDNPANMELMELIVERTPGLKLETAHNAELGIELARTRLPEVILLDINLPGMNGFQALKKLQTDKKTADIPVIALTANATRRDMEKGREAGFFAYLAKPVQIEEVTQTIALAMQVHRLTRDDQGL